MKPQSRDRARQNKVDSEAKQSWAAQMSGAAQTSGDRQQ